MAIDSCTSAFSEIATTVLLRYMALLRRALELRYPLPSFCTTGVGVKSILDRGR